MRDIFGDPKPNDVTCPKCQTRCNDNPYMLTRVHNPPIGIQCPKCGWLGYR